MFIALTFIFDTLIIEDLCNVFDLYLLGVLKFSSRLGAHLTGVGADIGSSHLGTGLDEDAVVNISSSC